MKVLSMLKRLTPFRRTRGAGTVKLLVLIPVALVLLLLLMVGFYEGRKAYWDYQVREMCAKDGGVVVLEHMKISREQDSFLPHSDGVTSISPESLADPRAPAFARASETVLRESQPGVFRYEYEVVRRIDGRLTAKGVIYLRSGGDIPLPTFPSRYYCPSLAKINADMSKVFVIEEPKK